MQQIWPDEGINSAISLLKNDNSNKVENIFDIGAHEGETIESIFQQCNDLKSYFAFEPNPETFQKLLLNCDGKYKNVHYINAAVGEHVGDVEFNITKESAVCGILKPENGLDERVPTGDHFIKNILKVKMTTIDECSINLNKIDLLKIDAEGYDLNVLFGAKESLNSGKIKAILVEVFFVKYRKNQCYFWDIASFLQKYNYSFVNLYDTRNTTQGRLYTGNGLWISNELAQENNFL
jgi:FkbM family methyltransferase